MSYETFGDMLGRTVESVHGETGDSTMEFRCTDGAVFRFYHSQDCCESVDIEDICGDVSDLVGSPLILAEEVSSEGAPELNAESYTWTFYRFATAHGGITVRWLGRSNGYYSEAVRYSAQLPATGMPDLSR